MIPLVATYRLQLRGGLDFDAVQDGLDYLADLGISHLYLSPIFTAVTGSTHGYDVTDPTQIDPVLGGEVAFLALAEAAKKKNIGIILDLVPNHTALSVENPWFADTLRHGETSAYAAYFDIDWAAGLLLPMLPRPLDDMLAERAFRLSARDGGAVEWQDNWLPLAPGSLPHDGRDDPDVIARVLAAQHWRLRHWQRERDSLTHRRFFNITDLIGMRVERAEVFTAMTALPLRLVADGHVQGLRIDHIDGLANPLEFLTRLRAEVGPDIPIWVEKILTGAETLPAHWPVDGTTGYEVATAVTALLTPDDGLQKLDAMWREATGFAGSFAETCRVTRRQILDEELAGERLGLIDAADTACRAEPGLVPGPESLREAVTALLVHFPRYRSYATANAASAEDRQIIAQTRDAAADALRDTAPLDRLCGFLAAPSTPAAVRWQTLFQQTTGALVAKAQEDTAFFRYNRLLAANEVGGDPDHATLGAQAFAEWAQSLPPLTLLLGSSHDTKRGEDARARLIACARRPDVFNDLFTDEANGLIEPNTAWYVVQSALAFWEDRDDLESRISDHLTKALREAREVTTWAYPDADAEAPVLAFGKSLVRRWRQSLPDAAAHLIMDGERLALAQVAVRLLLKGVPDIYQSSENGNFRLTDPDNRPLWTPAALLAPPTNSFAARKQSLIRQLLGYRCAAPVVFRAGSLEVSGDGNDRFQMSRTHGEQYIQLSIDLGAETPVDLQTKGFGSTG